MGECLVRLRSADEFVALFGEMFGVDPVETEHEWVYEFPREGQSLTIPLPKQQLVDAVAQAQSLDEVEETVVAGQNCYEVLVREESPFPRMYMRIREASIALSDSDNGITYRLAGPSDQFVLFLVDRASDVAHPRALLGPMFPRRMFERVDNGEIGDIFELFRRAIPRMLSLRVESEKTRTSSEMSKFADAFLFELSYNVDYALVPQRYLEESLRVGRITRLRRGSLDDLDVPRRHYVPDLIHHYELAVGADNPFLQYISYYHVAEHFFEAVFWDDMILRVRDKLTQPGFSYKRKKDIKTLIKEIRKSLGIRDETLTFSEVEALRLVLESYVDFSILREQLDEYDKSLVEYYQLERVPFSAGDTVDFENPDAAVVAKSLASRIYKTRCALVHSKDSDKSRYLPFRDDRVLMKEIPLLRFVAEHVIIGSSTVVA